MTLNPLTENNVNLTSNQVRDLSRKTLRETFPEVQINGYNYGENEIWDVLLFASAEQASVNEACVLLENAPSCNWMYTFLKQELLDLLDLNCLEDRLNESLRAGLPKRLGKTSQKVAIDLVLIPYYGDEATPMIRRSQAKRSTTKFFCYASAYVIKKNKRFTLTLTFTFVRPEDSLLGVLARLEQRIQEIVIRIKRLCLDREFARVDVFKFLEAKPYVPVIPVPKRGQTPEWLQQGKQSYPMFYTMGSSRHGQVTFRLWMVCPYRKGRAGKKGVHYLFFAVFGDCRTDGLAIAEQYRYRFGIETSYRLMNRTRAVTTSRNAAFRLVLVGLAFPVVNLWVWLKWNLACICRHNGMESVRFPLDLFCHLLGREIEATYGSVTELKL